MKHFVEMADMAPDHPLFGPVLKYRRAQDTIEALAVEIKAFLNGGAFSAMPVEDEVTGDLIFVFQCSETIPYCWSNFIGDALHNLRSVFDHIAWSVSQPKPNQEERVSFPIGHTEEWFQTNLPKKLPGASSEAIALVEGFQPYRGSPNDKLALLQELNNMDKHRLIIPAGMAGSGISIAPFTSMLEKMGELDGVDGSVCEQPRVFLASKEPIYPLANGTEIYRVNQAAKDSELSQHTKFHFDVAFGDGCSVSGQPLIPTLVEIRKFTLSAIDLFAEKLHGFQAPDPDKPTL